jgi:hypothetical protein
MTVTRRPAAASAFAMAAVIAAVGGCGTEPSDLVPGGYRLAAGEEVAGSAIACFASTWRYEGGSPIAQGDCDVALRSYEARFDSTGAVPTLVLSAQVRLESGETATWEIGIPTRVRNNVIEYDFSTVTAPLTPEQLFILPRAGTVVSGVLTLLMPTFASSGQPDRTEYFRQDPSVLLLTPTGRPPGPSTLAGRYTGVSFAGFTGEQCATPSIDQPNTCIHRSFTLTSGGGSWLAAYDQVVTAEGDTVGGLSVTAGNLTVVVHPSSFVRVASPETEGPHLRFDAEGSLVSGTLTLFIASTLFDGTPVISPIVARAR